MNFCGCIDGSDGKLRIKDAAATGAVFLNGIACLADYVFGDTTVGTPTGYSNSLPMASNRLVVSTGAIVYYRNGLPFDANGAMCVEAAAVSYNDQGTPFTSNGKVAYKLV